MGNCRSLAIQLLGFVRGIIKAIMSGSKWFKGTANLFTKYETGRRVTFNVPHVALCNRICQAAVIFYVIGYVFIVEKGYQQFETGESSVVAKVKGNQRSQSKTWSRSWITFDPADVVVPPLENNALFITTAMTFTNKQHHGKCADANVEGAGCFVNDNCAIGRPVPRGHGFQTGICNSSTGTCEVFAWCPLEKDSRTIQTLSGGENLTILVKNYILFPKMKVKRRNIGNDQQAEYLNSCIYHPVTDPYCPIFVLGDIVKLAGENFTSMARRGAILSFGIQWHCDLDFDPSYCLPKYSFQRLDDHGDLNFPGWSFRYAGYWIDEGDQQQARYLIKATGIRIIFNVYAVAGKFEIVKCTLTLGSSLGLVGVATMLCDYILLNCARAENRKKRQEALLDIGDRSRPLSLPVKGVFVLNDTQDKVTQESIYKI